MSLTYLSEGWLRFGDGHKWRCSPARYYCEVDSPGDVPNYLTTPGVSSRIRRIKSFYGTRVELGILDEFGTGLDILVANSLTESFGSVPSPLDTGKLREIYRRGIGIDNGVKLDGVVRYVAQEAKFLERREPGYVNPLSSPGRVSLGSHHMLIQTGLRHVTSKPVTGIERTGAIAELVCRLPADSLQAAKLAVRYFNRSHAQHQNQPPLLAATYNAGSPRLDQRNTWNLRQYGNHIDRWIRYYNTSRML